MRRMLWALCVLGLAVITVCAQQQTAPAPSPSADARIVRLQIGHTYGMCGGSGYCADITTVEPTFVVSQMSDAPQKKKFPDRKARRAITRKEWNDLLRAIEMKALTSLPPGRCYAHIDLPCTWLNIEFSDKTKIVINYSQTSPPAPIAALLPHVPIAPINFAPVSLP